MATRNVTHEGFDELLTSNELVFVDWWASWCGPCRSFAPVYEAVSEENPDVVFAKVDTERESELAGSFGIMSIPTLMIFKERVLLYSEPGALPPAVLRDLVEKAKEADMVEIHRQLEEAKANS